MAAPRRVDIDALEHAPQAAALPQGLGFAGLLPAPSNQVCRYFADCTFETVWSPAWA